MRVGDASPVLLWVAGLAAGAVLGALAAFTADALPKRLGITHLVTGRARARRNASLFVLAVACAAALVHLRFASPDASFGSAAFAFAVDLALACALLAAAAIDLEHMELPNELTLGGAALALASAPLRPLGLTQAAIGVGVGLAVSYVPALVYQKVRGQSGLGLGDTKLALLAGAWQGPIGVLFVLFAGALQSVLAAVIMRVAGVSYPVPESVRAEIDELRAKAEAGDAEARELLADDPMAGDEGEGLTGMRLPLGPFLALACLEMVLARDAILAAFAQFFAVR